MHSFDEDVGHGSLAGLGLEGVLDGGAIGDLVKLNDFECDVLGAKQALGLNAEGASTL